MTNIRLFCNLAVLIFSFAFGLKFYSLSNGDVLNHYPLISPDGFDWYTEGLYLLKSFSESHLPDLPVLRPPLFVFVTLSDYLLGGSGLVLALVYSMSILGTYFFTLWIIEKYLGQEQKKAWFHLPLAIAFTIYPINFIKSYLLTDSLAVCLSLFSVFILIKFFEEKRAYLLIFSSFLSILAGVTQTYALLPCLIYLGFKVCISPEMNKSNRRLLVANALFVSLMVVSITYLWRQVMPHHVTPQNFELLKLSLGMLGFYINTWGYYFLPFIIFVLGTRVRRLNFVDPKSILIPTILVCVVLGFLCFIYQWPEARFSYYFWPWAIIAFFVLVKPNDEKKATNLLVMLMLFISFLSPANLWQPSLKTLSFGYQNWAVNYFSLKPINRDLERCSGIECSGNEFLDNSDGYVKSVIELNLLLKNLRVLEVNP